MKNRSRHSIVLGLLLTLAAGAAMAGDVGRCLNADLPAAVVLPDGQRIESGRLTICHRRAFTPTQGMQEIAIDGMKLGAYTSRTSEASREAMFESRSSVADRPYLVFMRNDDRELELISYHRPLGERVHHHVFKQDGTPRIESYWKVSGSGRKQLDFAGLIAHDDVVLMAAN